MRRTPIRPLTPDDAEELAALCERNRDFLRPFDPDRDDRFFTPEGQRERLEQAMESARAGAQYAYAILDGERIAGVCSLQNVIRGASQSATVGYWVDEARNGRGLAGGAVAAVVALARDELSLHRLQAPVLPDNLASQRVLEKNGFERIGVARSYLHVGGEWRDHVLFQRLLG